MVVEFRKELHLYSVHIFLDYIRVLVQENSSLGVWPQSTKLKNIILRKMKNIILYLNQI